MIDTAIGHLRVVPNPECHHDAGSCHHVAILRAHDIEAVVCETIGRRAFTGLRAAGLDVFKPTGDSVAEIVQAARAGELHKFSADEVGGGGRRGHRHGHGGSALFEPQPPAPRQQAPSLPKEEKRTLAGRRIGLFGRGGSGKSTVSILLAKALHRAGYEVALLDADSTNAGLPEALGLERPPRPLIDHLGGMVFHGGAVTCPVDDPTPLAGGDVSLDELPEEYVGSTADGIALLVAGKMGGHGAGAGCDGPIAKIARDLKLRAVGKDLVTLVDFKAGFEDTARGVVIGLDWALVVVDPTLTAVHLATDMKQAIEELRAGALPATGHLEAKSLVALAQSLYRKARIRGLWCVLNNVPDERTEQYLRRRLAEKGIEPLGVIHSDASIVESWLAATALDAGDAIQEAEGIVQMLEREEERHANKNTTVA
jgi:CO dehydrogenase nickel-insertion accessory protein CooC1/predicted Fe-Mo cluster-binding NifX family protein